MSVEKASFHDLVREHFRPYDYTTWIAPLDPVREKKNLTLYAPNEHVYRKVDEEFLAEINRIMEAAGEAAAALKLDMTRTGNRNRPKAAPSRRKGRKMAAKLNPNCTFDNFIEGACNRQARKAALKVVDGDKSCKPLLLYGDVGLGKTHLLHAVGHAVDKADPNTTVIYMCAQTFTQNMVSAVRAGKMADFGKPFKSSDVLLVDDLQFFSGKDKTQDEFFHIFNSLQEKGGQIVLAADEHPKKIKGLKKHLQSRFVGGLTIEMEPPGLKTRKEILRKKAEMGCTELSDEVIAFVANKIHSNVRELEGALHKLTHIQVPGSEITTDQAKRALADQIDSNNSRRVGAVDVFQQVATHYQLEVTDLTGKNRVRLIVRARQIAMTLIRELTGMSLTQTGALFGGRDHSTVLHACRRIEALRQEDADLEKDIRDILKALGRQGE